MRSALRTSSRIPTSPLPSRLAAARLEPHDVRPIDAQLGGVLDGDDALGRRRCARPARRAARSCRVDVPPLITIESRARTQRVEQGGVFRRERAALDELVERERPRREAPQRQQWPVRRERRQHDVQPRAVGEARVDHRLRVVEAPAGSRRQPNAGIAQRLGVVETQRRALQAAAALDPDLARAR